MEVNSETFKPKNLVENKFFVDQFNKTFNNLIDQKHQLRSKAFRKNENIQFCRDWEDKLNFAGINNSIEALEEFKIVINKKSNKSRQVRIILESIYHLSIDEFMARMIKNGSDELAGK